MHSLEAITRINNLAFQAGPTQAIKDGLFVVSKFDGLHLTSYQTFIHQAEAEAYAEKNDSGRFPDERWTISYPAPVRRQLMTS